MYEAAKQAIALRKDNTISSGRVDADRDDAPLEGDSGAKPNTSPKTRLPRTNGKWPGEPGNGKWFSNKPEVNKITGGKGVEFKNGRPDFSPWKKGSFKFKEGVLDGSSNDFNAVYDKIKLAKGLNHEIKLRLGLEKRD